MSAGPRISVIIPTLNAVSELPATLQALDPADEIVVVDGGSTDGGPELALASGARVLRSSPGRGVQLAAGAAEAAGEWLLFLHADTVPAAGWRDAVGRHVQRSDGAAKAACFQFRLDDPSWQARLLERLVAMRTVVFALPYGDQGLLIHRDLYRAIGGYRPLPLMEDVDLVGRLGRRRMARLEVAATTSARRWRQDGWLRRSALNLMCLTLFRLGTPVPMIARLYGR